MGTDTEFWIVVINGVANLVIAGAAVVQSLVMVIGLVIGLNYLSKQRSIKSLELIIETKNLLVSYRQSLDNLYNIPFPLQKKIESNPEKFKQILADHLSAIFNNKKEEHHLIQNLKNKISLNLSILNRKDLIIKWIDCKMSFWALETRFQTLNEIMEEGSNSNWFKLFEKFPKSIQNNQDGPLIRAKRLYSELQSDLQKLYEK
ncbi:hypothetical protein [Algoriphagus formosus]|uniref:hypothetical protein n=1 Tax=Algoriphagus formosus TaxID=2007308 RepID=UPI003F6EC682